MSFNKESKDFVDFSKEDIRYQIAEIKYHIQSIYTSLDESLISIGHAVRHLEELQSALPRKSQQLSELLSAKRYIDETIEQIVKINNPLSLMNNITKKFSI